MDHLGSVSEGFVRRLAGTLTIPAFHEALQGREGEPAGDQLRWRSCVADRVARENRARRLARPHRVISFNDSLATCPLFLESPRSRSMNSIGTSVTRSPWLMVR